MNQHSLTRLSLAFGYAPYGGPALFRRCMEALGGPEALERASSGDLARVERMTRPFVEAWKNRGDLMDRADRELESAAKKGVSVWSWFDENYPSLLKTISDPPIALYGRGSLKVLEKSIAVVGSRQTSAYGEETAFRFGRDFARAGVCVVSGLANGIDSAAHRGALEGRGVTWAVLGGGLLSASSYRNPKLADEIVEKGGLVLSEYSLTVSPRPEFYPQRNRIVSGLSKGVVVVEAGRQSGALITAGSALEQGREVFAVPANINSTFSEGSNWLLRQGAKLVCSAEQALEDLGWAGVQQAAARLAPSLNDQERLMVGLLSPKAPLHLDDWIDRSGKNCADALAMIGTLVLKGAVAEKPGKYFMPERF